MNMTSGWLRHCDTQEENVKPLRNLQENTEIEFKKIIVMKLNSSQKHLFMCQLRLTSKTAVTN